MDYNCNWMFLLTISVLVFVTPLHCSNVPFRSKKSPSETIQDYEVIVPEISFSSERSKQGHPKTIKVSLQSTRDIYYLNLHLNEHLLSPDFVSGYHIKGVKHEEPHDNCFYHGTVEGHDKWNAVFSTCYGLRGWFGDLHDKDNLYHIEPLVDIPSVTGPHALYIDSEHQNNKDKTCGTNHKHEIGSVPVVDSMKSHDNHMLKKRQSSTDNIMVVEWLLINDFFQYDNYNRNISAVALRAIELANHVDMLYKALNIRVTLVQSLTWTDSQQILITSDSDRLLDEFQIYHRDSIDLRSIEHDSAMLITGIDIEGSTVGVAFLGTMCRYDTSVGFTQDTGSSVASVGGIASHELGHIFNMQHDDAAGCQCPNEDGCIMNAALGFPPPTNFSQCSKNQLAEGIEFKGAGECLDNNPSMIFGDPICGNGIKEPGEICDCGSLQECRDPCCNATNCILSIGSECAEGTCCDGNCRFISYGTTCRESTGVCGITEYCSGKSAECSQDVYSQNGVSCENGTSYCYDGECVSLAGQCTQYYGKESEPSVQQCYDDYNTQGIAQGHCGAANNAFIPCAMENARCGSIQCKGGSIIFDNITFTGTLTAYTRFVTLEGGGFEECQDFSTVSSADIISPGLVREGTKCGEDKICLSQECLSVTNLGVTSCRVGANGLVCSDNGVCNNLDQCSCNIGFNGSDCSETVSLRNTGGNVAAIAAGVMVVIAILIAAAIVIVVVLFVLLRNKKMTGGSNLQSPRKSKYTQRHSSDHGSRPGIHGSTDDLLMTGVTVTSNTPSPVPPAHESPRSYQPYVPPPSTTVSQNIRKQPPPPSQLRYVGQQPSPRPPPPSRPPPASVKPPPPINRPMYTPPVNKLTPPFNKPGQSQKPIPAVRTNISAVKPPIVSTKPPPQTAQKPSKIAVQWPPPSEDTSSKPSAPVPPKKPIIPRK